jgi:hydrogenase/urease accessory protein HupE
MTRRFWLSLVFVLSLCASRSFGHEVRPAYLELRQIGAETYAVLWKVPGRGEGLRLALYPELPAGSENLGPPQPAFHNDAFSERWTFRRAGGLSGGTIRIAGLEATVTDALVRIERLDGSLQVARLTPSSPSFVVESAPGGMQIAATYLRLGIEHILLGYDHLLFVLALMLVVAGRWALLKTITAFTVAHSITLGLAVLGFVHIPRPPVEAANALSIQLLATEIMRRNRGAPSLTVRAPWVVAFAFGLLHGLGFAGALIDAGLPAQDVPLALLAFNVGVEVGQLMFVGSVLAAGLLLSRWRLPDSAPLRARPALAYAIGTLAAFWFIDRLAGFWS